jgi:hypothetical protein
MLRIVECEKPKLKMPTLLCDDEIHKKLNDFELTSLMNKSFACLIAGKAGSGKTSLLYALISTPCLFQRCFDKIFLFMPKNSRDSLKDSVFDGLPEDQINDVLSLETLSGVFDRVQDLSKQKKRCLVIFDDVQQFFKGECERLITHMIANRRHNRLSMFFLAQTYKKVPRSCRLGMSDLFCFRLSYADLQDIKSELIDIPDQVWQQILMLYHQQLHAYPRMFLYINPSTNKVFFDWDELDYSQLETKLVNENS